MSDQVEEVKQKTDIVSLISDHVELKKAGRNYKALCPFHSEKTPSFMVSPELQIYKCFGCSKSGDAISFLQEYEGMDFYEALKFLADRTGVKLKPIKGRQAGIKEKLYQINSKTSHFYNYVLLKHPAGQAALNYLTKKRGLTLDTIKKFALGFSPNRPLALKTYLVDKKGIKTGDLEKAGIVYYGRGRAYDRFRGRITFPLHDARGNIAGFAGRILPSPQSKDLAKYINTPETPVYHKSRILYGLNLTKAEIKRQQFAVVVEGELDMISSWQVGIKNVVAVKGTALTQDQVKLLSRLTEKIVLALDADVAGDTAALRGIEIAEKEGFDIRVARLTKFKDPDEAARKNPDALRDSIKNAQSIWDFIIDTVFTKYKDQGGSMTAKISRELVPVLFSIKDKIVQAHYVEVIAKKLNVPAEAVYQQISKVSKRNEVPRVEVAEKPGKSRREFLEERLLTVAFRCDPLILSKRRIYSLFKTPLATRLLAEFRRFMKKVGEFDPSEFAGTLPSELVNGFVDMVLRDLEGLKAPDGRYNQYEREIKLLEKELQLINVKDKLKEITVRIREIEVKKGKRGLQKAKEEFEKLTRKLTELEDSGYKGIIL
jgi:DNA primase